MENATSPPTPAVKGETMYVTTEKLDAMHALARSNLGSDAEPRGPWQKQTTYDDGSFDFRRQYVNAAEEAVWIYWSATSGTAYC
jgi:hypothetical protein